MGISLEDVLESLNVFQNDAEYFLRLIAADKESHAALLKLLRLSEKVLREADEQRKGE